MPDIFSSDALAALLLVIAVLQFKRIGGFFNLSKVRLRSSVWSTVPRGEVPEHTRHLLDCAETGLDGIGFQRVCTQAAAPFNAFDPRALMFSDLYWHPGQSVLARVELAEALTGQVTKVRFLSLFADGGALATVNREQWALLPVPEDIVVEDAYADDLAGQWQAHREAMASETDHRVAITGQDEALRREAALGLPHWIDRMRRLGWVREESDGIHRFTARGAWAYAGQLARLPAPARKALVRPYRHDPSPDLQTARLAEMDSMAAILALASRPLPTWIKAGLFMLTLALSVMLFGRGFGLMEAGALLTVLLVHELGHLAAMWAFDYRNLSIFFLPFLGAAATGHKPHAPPWQEAVVLLAGPVPGLVLAFAATQIPSEALPLPAIAFIRSWFWFSVFLNLFNLLPIGVLDGGRLFELAVLGRFPYARAVFAALGVAVGALYAAWSQSLALGVVMLLLIFAVPLQFKVAGVIASIRAKAAGMKPLDGEQAIHALGRQFSSQDYGGSGPKGWMQRLNIARLAYPRLLQGVPGLGVSLGVLAAMGVSVLGPLVLLAWSWRQPEPAPLMRSTPAEQQAFDRQREAQPEQIQAKLARDAFMARYEALQDPEAKWALLDQHEEDDVEEFGFDPAHYDWLKQQRAVLIGQLPADHPGMLWHRLSQAGSGSPGTTETLLAVIAQLGAGAGGKAANLDEERFVVLMEAYRRLAKEAMPDTLEAQRPALDALWGTLEPPGHPLAWQRAALAAIRARMAFSAGKLDEAESWMERFHPKACPEDGHAALTHAWFLLDIGRPDQVLAMASQAIEVSTPQSIDRPHWQTLAGWAEMGHGHPREADAYFQAVLDGRAARLAASREGMPWWLRMLSRGTEAMFMERRWIDAPTFDHLAALEGYDPPAAERLRAELAQSLGRQGNRMPPIDSTSDGWGKAREAAHGKLLKALDVAP